MAIDPTGRFAYVANSGSGTVSAYTINALTGALSNQTTVAAGGNPESVTVDASGKFAYAVNRGTSDVSIYSINQATGVLTSTGTVAAGTSPTFITLTGAIQ